MRTPIRHFALFVLLVVLLTSILPAITTANSVAVFNSWANDLVRSPEDPPYLSLHYRIRKVFFSIDPSSANPIIFLGDSITYGGDWDRLFPNSPVENRGIGGDSTLGLLNRLDQIIALKPSQIYLMIGTNDLCYGRSIPNILNNYRLILERFKKELPNTKVYVQSVLPFNDSLFPTRGLRNNNEISKINVELRKLAGQYNYPYLDLASSFTGSDGRLQAEYTDDGLHLSQAGYQLWRAQIKHLVAGSGKTAI